MLLRFLLRSALLGASLYSHNYLHPQNGLLSRAGLPLEGGNPVRCDDRTILLNDQYQQPNLDGGDVLGLHALVALGRLIGDLLALFEGPEPAACYPAIVHEEVFASVVGLDEAVALLAVEPLDRSLGHVPKLAFLFPWGNPRFDCGGNIPE